MKQPMWLIKLFLTDPSLSGDNDDLHSSASEDDNILQDRAWSSTTTKTTTKTAQQLRHRRGWPTVPLALTAGDQMEARRKDEKVQGDSVESDDPSESDTDKEEETGSDRSDHSWPSDHKWQVVSFRWRQKRDGKENVEAKKSVKIDATKFKTKLCRNYSLNGENNCKFGSDCAFAHGTNELREASGPPMLSALDRPTARPPLAVRSNSEICESYFKFGKCSLGGGCPFSHGRSKKNGA